MLRGCLSCEVAALAVLMLGCAASAPVPPLSDAAPSDQSRGTDALVTSLPACCQQPVQPGDVVCPAPTSTTDPAPLTFRFVNRSTTTVHLRRRCEECGERFQLNHCAPGAPLVYTRRPCHLYLADCSGGLCPTTSDLPEAIVPPGGTFDEPWDGHIFVPARDVMCPGLVGTYGLVRRQPAPAAYYLLTVPFRVAVPSGDERSAAVYFAYPAPSGVVEESYQ